MGSFATFNPIPTPTLPLQHWWQHWGQTTVLWNEPFNKQSIQRNKMLGVS